MKIGTMGECRIYPAFLLFFGVLVMWHFRPSVDKSVSHEAISMTESGSDLPLDRTGFARLINMKHHCAKADPGAEVQDHPDWYQLLHSGMRSAHQLSTEKTIMSWFLRGHCDARPEWFKTEAEKNTDQVALDRAVVDGTLHGLWAYQASADVILEKVDHSWTHGFEAPRGEIKTTSETYWSDLPRKTQ